MTTVIRKISPASHHNPLRDLQRVNLSVLKKVQGMWERRKTDPIKELAQTRKDWK